MAQIDWNAISDFERYPIIEMKIGDEIKGTFEDDGNFVSKDQMAQVGAKYPRDNFVFVLTVGEEKKEFWLGAKNFTILRELKRIREENAGTLKGITFSIKRVSDQPTETNYEFTKV